MPVRVWLHLLRPHFLHSVSSSVRRAAMTQQLPRGQVRSGPLHAGSTYLTITWVITPVSWLNTHTPPANHYTGLLQSSLQAQTRGDHSLLLLLAVLGLHKVLAPIPITKWSMAGLTLLTTGGADRSSELDNAGWLWANDMVQWRRDFPSCS